MNTIASQWASFEHSVVPANASEIQRIEMKRSFYAGAGAMLSLMTGTIAKQSEAAGVQMVKGLHQECRTFALDVEEGRA